MTVSSFCLCAHFCKCFLGNWYLCLLTRNKNNIVLLEDVLFISIITLLWSTSFSNWVGENPGINGNDLHRSLWFSVLKWRETHIFIENKGTTGLTQGTHFRDVYYSQNILGPLCTWGREVYQLHWHFRHSDPPSSSKGWISFNILYFCMK